MQELKVPNLNLSHGSIEELPFTNDFFDCIFCYSVIYHTDFRKSLKEMHRTLKKGGMLYVNTNDLGWYIYNLLSDSTGYNNFSPKQYALDTIQNSISFYSQNIREEGKSLIMPQKYTLEYLERLGFDIIGAGPDGHINTENIPHVKSFYNESYEGLTNVYEILCKKK